MVGSTKMSPVYFIIVITTVILVVYSNAVDLNSTCGSNEWTCADGGCVGVDQKCDGDLNCEDGSDETLANCKGTQRPMIGLILHCSSFWTDAHSGVCPDICRNQPKFCYYALLAANGAPGTCTLPAFPKNGSYGIITDYIKAPDSNLVDFSLQFRCDHGTVAVGDTESRCENGRWTREFPYCSEACKLNKKPEYTFKCTMGSKKDALCGDYVAIGTVVAVERRQFKKTSTNTVAYILCTESHAFNISSKCVEDLDTRLNNFERDEIQKISHFQAEFEKADQKTYKFAQLVSEYRKFEEYISANSTQMQQKAEECDIYLGLLETSTQT